MSVWEAVETFLTTYGVLGLWTAYLLWEKRTVLAKLQTSIDKNTDVIEKIGFMLDKLNR